MTATYLRQVTSRAVALWILVRAGLALLRAVNDLPPVIDTSAGTAVAVTAVTAALAMVDLARRGERVFLGNLGVAPATVALVAAVPAVVLEACLMVVVTAAS